MEEYFEVALDNALDIWLGVIVDTQLDAELVYGLELDDTGLKLQAESTIWR